MRIQHNIQALRAQRQTNMNNQAAGKSLEKLSSGFAINRAADGAASLAISEKMRAQIRGLDRATQNAQDSISLMQTAEGALQETQSILQRMRELSVQSANGIYQAEDREKINDEFKELSSEITRIAENTKFNDIKVMKPSYEVDGANNFEISGLNNVSNISVEYAGTGAQDVIINYTGADGQAGSTTIDMSGVAAVDGYHTKTDQGITIKMEAAQFGADIAPGTSVQNIPLNFQIGASASESISLSISDMSSGALGVDAEAGAIDVLTVANANTSISAIDKAISQVSSQRAKLGSTQNRVEHAINNLGVSVENLTASESRIRDVDMAKEMMNFTKNNILSQASQSMLAQANAQPQSVLQLLQG